MSGLTHPTAYGSTPTKGKRHSASRIDDNLDKGGASMDGTRPENRIGDEVRFHR